MMEMSYEIEVECPHCDHLQTISEFEVGRKIYTCGQCCEVNDLEDALDREQGEK